MSFLTSALANAAKARSQSRFNGTFRRYATIAPRIAMSPLEPVCVVMRMEIFAN